MARSATDVDRADGSGGLDDLATWAWRAFAVLWAVSVLLHLAGNTRLAPAPVQALVGGAAVAVLATGGRRTAAAGLAVAVVVGVWAEAPVLANHWLLHGLLALLVLAVVADPSGPAGWYRRLVGPGRLLLLGFYGFAAFAKLNADFLDPAVSCATFYLRESIASWGGDGFADGVVSGPVEASVAPLVAFVELSVPVLLVLRRTRVLGVVVALTFHLVLALDRTHQFFDFSSVLAVLFVLFLPPEVLGQLRQAGQRATRAVATRRASAPELGRLLGLAVAALAVVVVAGPRSWPAPPLLRDLGVLVWIGIGTALPILVWRAARATGSPWVGTDEALVPGVSRTAWRHAVLLLLVPALAVANGLTPYLELKSGFGWNMYGNLSVVDGASNHLVVRRGLPLTDAHDRLVAIEHTTDPRLEGYVDRWLLPEVQLEDFIAGRAVVVRGTVDGEPVTYDGRDVDARPTWQRKLLVFRAVDADGAVDCQPSFLPAR